MSDFFASFFGVQTTNRSGEVAVCCPFEHDKGFETNPSAHINYDKGVFHCKTCFAEGRNTGFSEPSFISEFYNISYGEAVRFMTSFNRKVTESVWDNAVATLHDGHEDLFEYLASRGITVDTAIKYKLGYSGSGIDYPVFINHTLCDVRTYNKDYKTNDMPKIRSQSGASPLLFPFDDWMETTGPTLLCAGENDTLLARQFGFNAVTGTGGEGNFPKIFLPYFKGKEVYVCYDCDEAGKVSAQRVAFQLFEAGSSVRIVDLGLAGTKDDKDITDYFIKHSHSADDLYKLMQQAYSFTGEMYAVEKEKVYPLVDLWDAVLPKYENRYISSRVMMMGKFENSHGTFLKIPSAIQYECPTGPIVAEGGEVSPVCRRCPLSKTNEYWWDINEENLKLVVQLVETDDQHIDEVIAGNEHIPLKDCPGKIKKTHRDRVIVQRVLFSPDVDTEDELRGYRSAELQAYVINPKLEDGQRYRVYFKSISHYKNRAAVMVVDRVEESDSAINAFKMTPQIVEELSQFQGSPVDVMQRRFDMSKVVVAPSVPRQVQEAVDILYHSVLDFKYGNELLNKGYPEGAIVGDTRTGKSEAAKKLLQFYGIGNHTELKASTVPGLLATVESQKSGGWRIKWGKIPRNNRGLVILDEASGITKEQMAHLTGVRSERIATIEKAASGKAPASTRLLWIANPREQADGSNLPIAAYSNGIEILVELFGTNQDIARLDYVVLVPKSKDGYIPPFKDEKELAKLEHLSTPYRNLIRWAWSRRSDQVKFSECVEQYIWQVSQELNELYDTESTSLFGAEAYKKLARIAVSIAVMCFSHDGTGDVVLVSKDHVDYARRFLTDCYDNAVFRIRDYAEQSRFVSETNEEVNNEFEKLVRTQPLLIKTLNSLAQVSTLQLKMVTGMEPQVFSDTIARMLQMGLITVSSNAIHRTLRFVAARDAYLQIQNTSRMVPLAQQGGSLL